VDKPPSWEYYFHPPTEAEWRQLEFLCQLAGVPSDALDELAVADMNDGGMGSLRLAPSGVDTPARRMSRQGAEFEYADDDGVLVQVSLNLDEQGQLFELDSWKVDFKPLINRRVPGEGER